MKLVTWITFILAAMGNLQQQSAVTFCDLVRNPEKYNGQQVTVRATWRQGFEWSYLYCLDCRDNGKVWLALDSDLDEASVRALHKVSGAGIANLTVQGTFLSGKTYGHQNGYRYEIVPTKITNVAVILKGSKSSGKEQQIEKRWACGGINPK